MKKLPIALEITPPMKPSPKVLLRRARGLSGRTSRINVISRPDRWSSLAASERLAAAGFSPVWHLANRGRSALGIEADIAEARRVGVHRVLCLRGQRKARDGFDTPKIREVVRMVQRGLPGAEIGVTLNHHLPRERVLANLWPKLEAGATRVQTQVTFELETLEPFAEEICERFPSVQLVPMILPVLSPEAAIRAAKRLGIVFPADEIGRLARGGADSGWASFRALAAAIAKDPLYAGAAIMTPIDPSPVFLSRLRDSF